MPSPGGSAFHAEFVIGNIRICISDEYEESHAFAMPKRVTALCLNAILVEDCDSAHERAVACDATTLSAPADQLWGPCTAMVRDPFGYRWYSNPRTEDLTGAEIE